MTKLTYHLTGQETYPSPSISLCVQSFHWIKACFCVPFAKIKTFCTNIWVLLYKNFSSYGTSSSCCLRKYINTFFFLILLYKYLQCSSAPHLTVHCPPPCSASSPPFPAEPFVFTAQSRGRRAQGCPSGGVCAGGRRRRVQVVRIAALGVGGRRAALAVLLGRQVLAARRGRRWHRLRVVVEVAGVALGGGCGDPAARGVVTVAHVRAAGRRGWCEMPVAVGPVAVAGRWRGEWVNLPFSEGISQGGNRKQGNLCSNAQHLLSRLPCRSSTALGFTC